MTLTVDDLREHLIDCPLGDDALGRVLDAAYAWIDTQIGPAGSRTELAFGGYGTIALSRPAASIGSVSELVGTTTTNLDASDYRLRPDGYILERLSTGTNPRWQWWGQVTVTYTPTDDDEIRDSVAIDLCKLAINTNPGVQMEQIGAWMQQLAANSAWNTTEEWATILSRLDPTPGMIVVGESRWSAW